MRFLDSLFRNVQFLIGDKPVENCPHSRPEGDWPAVPSHGFPGLLTAPFVNSREDCAGGQSAPGAFVDCGGVPTPPDLSTFHEKRSRL